MTTFIVDPQIPNVVRIWWVAFVLKPTEWQEFMIFECGKVDNILNNFYFFVIVIIYRLLPLFSTFVGLFWCDTITAAFLNCWKCVNMSQYMQSVSFQTIPNYEHCIWYLTEHVTKLSVNKILGMFLVVVCIFITHLDHVLRDMCKGYHPRCYL